MRFNSVSNSDYSASARAVTKNMDSMYDTSRKTAPDFNAIAEVALEAKSQERRAVMEASSKINRQGIKSKTDVELVKLKQKTEGNVKDILRPAKRMAGVVAGLGTLSTAYMTKKTMDQDKADRAELKLERDAFVQQQQELMATLKASDQKIIELQKANVTKADESLTSSTNSTTDDSPSGSRKLDGSDKKDTTASAQISSPQTSVGLTMSTLSGNQEKVASRVRSVESGKWGYDAFNQFGDAGGQSNRGTGGAYGEKYGTPLTNMSLADVMAKQKDHNNKSVSDSQWQQQGGIWAAGAYQFIPTTLASVVQRGGFDTSRKFDAKLQDELFAFHVKDSGSLQPWVGIRGADDYGSLNTLALQSF